MRDTIKYLLAIGVLLSGFYLAKQYQYRGEGGPDEGDELATATSPRVDLEPSQPESGFADPVAVLLDVDRMLADSAQAARDTAGDPPGQLQESTADPPGVSGRPTIRKAGEPGKGGRRNERPRPKPARADTPPSSPQGIPAGDDREDRADPDFARSRGGLEQEASGEAVERPAVTAATDEESEDVGAWAAPPPSLATEYAPRLEPIHPTADDDPGTLSEREPQAGENSAGGAWSPAQESMAAGQQGDESPEDLQHAFDHLFQKADQRDPQTTGPQGSDAVARPKLHLIAEGDTLPKLAEAYLGDRSRYGEVFQANQDVLSDPRLLPIGVEITIPARTPDTR